MAKTTANLCTVFGNVRFILYLLCTLSFTLTLAQDPFVQRDSFPSFDAPKDFPTPPPFIELNTTFNIVNENRNPLPITTTTEPITTQIYPTEEFFVKCHSGKCFECSPECSEMSMRMRNGIRTFVGDQSFVLSSYAFSSNSRVHYMSCRGNEGRICGSLLNETSYFHLILGKFKNDVLRVKRQGPGPPGPPGPDPTNPPNPTIPPTIPPTVDPKIYDGYSIAPPTKTWYTKFKNMMIHNGLLIIDMFFWSILGWYSYKYFNTTGIILVVVARFIILASAQCDSLLNYGVIRTELSSHAVIVLHPLHCVTFKINDEPGIMTLRSITPVSQMSLYKIYSLENQFLINHETCCSEHIDNCPQCPQHVDKNLQHYTYVTRGLTHGCFNVQDWFHGISCSNITVLPSPSGNLDVWHAIDNDFQIRIEVVWRGTSKSFNILSSGGIIEHPTLGRMQISYEMTTHSSGNNYYYIHEEHDHDPSTFTVYTSETDLTHLLKAPYSTTVGGTLIDTNTIVKWLTCDWDLCEVNTIDDMSHYMFQTFEKLNVRKVSATVTVDSTTGLKTISNITSAVPVQLTIDFQSPIDGYAPNNPCLDSDITIISINSQKTESLHDTMVIVFQLVQALTKPCAMILPTPPSVCAFDKYHHDLTTLMKPRDDLMFAVKYSCYADAVYGYQNRSITLRSPGFLRSIANEVSDLWTKHVGLSPETHSLHDLLMYGYKFWDHLLGLLWKVSFGWMLNVQWSEVHVYFFAVLFGILLSFLDFRLGVVGTLVMAVILKSTVVDAVDYVCAGVNCGVGSCIQTSDRTYYCACPNGVSGDTPQKCDKATGKTCANGKLMPTSDGSACICDEGYEGDLCQYVRGSCTSLSNCSFDTPYGCFFTPTDAPTTLIWSEPTVCNPSIRSDVIAATALDYDIMSYWGKNVECRDANLLVALFQSQCTPEPDCGWYWQIGMNQYPARNIPWALANPETGLPSRNDQPDMLPLSAGNFARVRRGLRDFQRNVEFPDQGSRMTWLCHAGSNRCNIPCMHGVCVGDQCVCKEGYYGADCSTTTECYNGYVVDNKCQCKPGYVGALCDKKGCPCHYGELVHGECMQHALYKPNVDVVGLPNKNCRLFIPNDVNEMLLVKPKYITGWKKFFDGQWGARPMDLLPRAFQFELIDQQTMPPWVNGSSTVTGRADITSAIPKLATYDDGSEFVGSVCLAPYVPCDGCDEQRGTCPPPTTTSSTTTTELPTTTSSTSTTTVSTTTSTTTTSTTTTTTTLPPCIIPGIIAGHTPSTITPDTVSSDCLTYNCKECTIKFKCADTLSLNGSSTGKLITFSFNQLTKTIEPNSLSTDYTKWIVDRSFYTPNIPANHQLYGAHCAIIDIFYQFVERTTPKTPLNCDKCINGDCVNGTCNCKSGWDGKFCDVWISRPINCINGDIIDGVCVCSTNFTGSSCQFKLQHKSIQPGCKYNWPLCLMLCDNCPRSNTLMSKSVDSEQCPYSAPLSYFFCHTYTNCTTFFPCYSSNHHKDHHAFSNLVVQNYK